ncbi:protein DpdJ [Rhodococcus koreensis]
MTDSLPKDFLNELLNRCEDLELPLLSWGLTDVALDEEEVLAAIRAVQHHYPGVCLSAEEVLERCVSDLTLFLRLPDRNTPKYRTRIAEAVRLTANLRQLFAPRNTNDHNSWRTGKNLVADYRLHVAPRRYPRRDVSAEELVRDLSSAPGSHSIQKEVIAAQTRGRLLSQFQVDSARAIFTGIRSSRNTAVVVGAGTGSGKTLAFYLPAFTDLVNQVRENGRHVVHTLALYPRKELLRDQLADALSTVLTLNPLLARHGLRPLRLGALYQDVPSHPEAWTFSGQGTRDSAWTRTSKGWVCPFVPCPTDGCDHGRLIWADTDRRARRERLRCDSCGVEIDGTVLALTRDSMRTSPPDLLFTTTEMLNRASTDPNLDTLTGWSLHTPRLVLMDEIHTYSGVPGAQVAHLLRRWRSTATHAVTFVGLSATLRNADTFFGSLVGLDSTHVRYIEPRESDLESEGRQYSLALRNDPVAGASVLSTSIQAAMLLGRILDSGASDGIFGSTGFLFTDNLDVTNRFYNDLRDAEGGQSRNGIRGGWRPVLAALRSSRRPDHMDRFRDGQSWDIVERIGRTLDPDLRTGALRIGRTSSQDAGVSSTADLIVATAALEVGFNDSRVGLVLQHKAPLNSSAFIQRRGRAGRQRGTRPLTVVSLSDYGRDRFAYESYETLFDPEVEARSLPVTNRFVLKIQGTHALLDWLNTRLRRQHRFINVRDVLTAPKSGKKAPPHADREAVIELLQRVLNDTFVRDQVAEHLRRTLQISEEHVQAILWEQPRSILLAVVPTALRRLRSNWTPVSPDPGATPDSLLPEFVTRALFSQLDLPEVMLHIPFTDEPEYMPILQALREAVPGRVSRRFGHRRDDHRTWLPMPDNPDDVIDLDTFVVLGETLGIRRDDTTGGEVTAVRPYEIALSVPDKDVADRSQAIPVWSTEITPRPFTPLTPADIPSTSSWGRTIQSVDFAMHSTGNPVDVHRTSAQAHADFVNGQGQTSRHRIRYSRRGEPAALGFTLPVDGIRFRIAPLDLENDRVHEHLRSPQWRTYAFLQEFTNDAELADVVNPFQAGWLGQVYLTAFALTTAEGTTNRSDAVSALSHGGWAVHLPEILRVLYRNDSDEDWNDERLVAVLSELSDNPEVRRAIDRAAQVLVADNLTDRTSKLARRTYLDTLAGAVLATCLRACPDVGDTDLVADVTNIDKIGAADVWITETSVGGTAFVEDIARFYTSDPRRFWSLTESALGPTEYEYVDAALTSLLRHARSDPNGELASALQRLRSDIGASASIDALRTLRQKWGAIDSPPRHSALAALSSRLLRKGSGPSTDTAVLDLIDNWDAWELTSGIELDSRIVAYLSATRRRSSLNADQIFSLLWPRGPVARNRKVMHYQPYRRELLLDRLLASASLSDTAPSVDVTIDGWEDKYRTILHTSSTVDLWCPCSATATLADALIRIPALPVFQGHLTLYGQVRGVRRSGTTLTARVEISESLQ